MTDITTPLAGIDITANMTSAEAVGVGETAGKRGGHKLGTQAVGVDGTTFVLCKVGTSSFSASHWIGIDENFTAAKLTQAMTSDNYGIGIAQTALTLNRYGWICTRGSNVTGLVLKACAADAVLYTTATAGVLDDSRTSAGTADQVEGAACVTAASASAPATGQAVEIIFQNGATSGAFAET